MEIPVIEVDVVEIRTVKDGIGWESYVYRADAILGKAAARVGAQTKCQQNDGRDLPEK